MNITPYTQARAGWWILVHVAVGRCLPLPGVPPLRRAPSVIYALRNRRCDAALPWLCRQRCHLRARGLFRFCTGRWFWREGSRLCCSRGDMLERCLPWLCKRDIHLLAPGRKAECQAEVRIPSHISSCIFSGFSALFFFLSALLSVPWPRRCVAAEVHRVLHHLHSQSW